MPARRLPSSEAIRQELDSITSSALFERSKRLCGFLAFVVELQLAGKTEQIKEHAIGVAVFERGSDFDPSKDNIVRVEASRLRHKLREFYQTEGQRHAVRIDIPKGSYIPVFDVVEIPADEPLAAAVQPPRRTPFRPSYIAAAGLILALICSATVVFAIKYERRKSIERQAAKLCEKGRFHWNLRSHAHLLQSIEAYKEALALDPGYAVAWTGLADTYAVLVGNGYSDSESFVPAGIAAAKKAIQLNPRSGRPHSALATLLFFANHDLSAAERENRLAVQLSPNDGTAHQWYGHFLGLCGRFDDALAELRRAEEQDPLQAMIGVNIGDVYQLKNDYDSALKQYRKTLEMQPYCTACEIGIAAARIARHQYKEALAELNRWVALFPDDEGLNAAVAICRRNLNVGSEHKNVARLQQLPAVHVTKSGN